jgi:hypothetical protein
MKNNSGGNSIIYGFSGFSKSQKNPEKSQKILKSQKIPKSQIRCFPLGNDQ